MNRKIYVYQKNITEEIIELFSNLGDNFSVYQVSNDIITVLDNDYYNEDPFDIEALVALISDDFDGNVSVFIEPYLVKDFKLGNEFSEFIKEIPPSIYYFEDIITYVVIKERLELKHKIASYITALTNNEIIHTVREFIDNNMNSSVSAKKLYMHRNTLNYRVDNFCNSTGINVKTFKGANAIYMLFKF